MDGALQGNRSAVLRGLLRFPDLFESKTDISPLANSFVFSSTLGHQGGLDTYFSIYLAVATFGAAHLASMLRVFGRDNAFVTAHTACSHKYLK